MTRSTDLHRVYLQSMLSRRVVRLEIGLELYKRAVANVQGMSSMPGAAIVSRPAV